MIIDIHTHTFPDKIAVKTIEKLAAMARSAPFSDGTVSGLQTNMKRDGVDYSVLQPVVTKPQQATTINESAVQINETSEQTGIISFGGLHPDNEDYKEQIVFLADHKVKGIKVHPAYQGVNFDDDRYLRILDCAFEHGLYVLTHAGFDVGMPGVTHACVEYILPVLEKMDTSKLILAHMAGFDQWDMVEEYICGANVYMDTAYSLLKIVPLPGSNRRPEEDPPMEKEQFKRIVKKHGADKILFGTDNPWDSAERVVDCLKNMELSADEEKKILGENARKILGV